MEQGNKSIRQEGRDMNLDALVTGAAYTSNPRQCPKCRAEQIPQADSITNPVQRKCACGFKWCNVFRKNKLVGYDPRGNK